jgi:hypothetical protein
VARISGDLQRLDIAKIAAATVLSSPFAVPYFAVAARIGLAVIAVQGGDVTAAKEQYAALEPGRGVMALYIGTDRLLGLLSVTMGQLDQAAQHFEDALAFCRKAGYRPELAWSLCDYADLLLAPSTSSGRADGRRKAMTMLDESLAISSELGMRPLMERVLSRREILRA